MSWFEDLSPCDYWDSGLFDIFPTSVGWLAASHGYTKGEVPSNILRKLCDCLVDNWEPGELIYRGFQDCPMCGFWGDYVSPFGHKFTIGNRNLFIPSANRDFLFTVPSTIVHYIVEHQYLPPKSFLAAVDLCPQMGSVAYLQAIEPHWSKTEPMKSIFLRSFGMAYARDLGCADVAACSKDFRRIYEEDSVGMRLKILDEARDRFQHDLSVLESFLQSQQVDGSEKVVKSIQAWIKAYRGRFKSLEVIAQEKRMDVWLP